MLLNDGIITSGIERIACGGGTGSCWGVGYGGVDYRPFKQPAPIEQP